MTPAPGNGNCVIATYMDLIWIPRPIPGVHLRVNEYPQSFLKGPHEKGFLALLQLEDGSAAEQEDVDRMFRELLSRVMATDISEIEPYD